MALYVDFVGLNTLIEEPIDVNTNVVGRFAASRPSSGSDDPNEVRNTHASFETDRTISANEYLAALNSHRNGPYGYPIFRQLRAGQSPIIRRQRLTNIFSHYEYPGPPLVETYGRDIPSQTIIIYGPDLPKVGESFTITGQGTTVLTVSFESVGTSETTFGQTLSNTLKIDPTDSSTETIEAIATRIRDAWRAHALHTGIGIIQSIGSDFGTIRHHLVERDAPNYSVTSDTSTVPNITSRNIKREQRLIRTTADQRRAPVEHFNEVPVVSKHRPLRMIGSVTTADEVTNKDVMERVEVYTTLGNETQYFSNSKLNKFYNTEEIVSEDYENFVDLYLEGGVDGDESPVDEFRYLSYKQVVYPKEIYTYKNHTRNRINFVSRYWRDLRTDRTERDVNNGFGFNVFSQSAWVLDGEEDFKNLTYQITPGTIEIQHPNRLNTIVASVTSASTDASGFVASSSTATYAFAESGGPTDQRSISIVNLGDRRFNIPSSKWSPIAGAGGYPKAHLGLGTNTQGDVPIFKTSTTGAPQKVAITYNPFDIGTDSLRRMTRNLNTVSAKWANPSDGLRLAFEDRGYKIETGDGEETGGRFIFRNVTRAHRGLTSNTGMRINVPDADAWRLNTTSSTISTWLAPNVRIKDIALNRFAGADSDWRRAFLSGTFYHEEATATPFTGQGDATSKISKIINFDPGSGGGDTGQNGGVTVRLGTTFVSSRDGSLVYIGADEYGAVEYKTNNFYGSDNPIYSAALNWNKGLNSGLLEDRNIAKFIAATNETHFIAELNLSGSEPQLGLASSWAEGVTGSNADKRGGLFRQKHAAHDASSPQRARNPNGYADIYVNTRKSVIASSKDPYRFLSGSEGNYHKQLTNGNSSIKLKNITTNRRLYYLHNDKFDTLNPFTSKGFAFSYWIKFGQNPNGYDNANNLIFSIHDDSGNPILDHSIGGVGKLIRIGVRESDGTIKLFEGVKTDQWIVDTWYNVTFSFKNDAGTMAGTLKVYKNGEASPEAFTGTPNWVTAAPYGSALQAGDWANVNSSDRLYVLPSSGSFKCIRDNAGSLPPATALLDNLNLDSLVFWNGGLSTHQMESMVSGSHITNNNGKAGDLTPAIEAGRFPASDTSQALEAVINGPTLRHARRNWEMNTYRQNVVPIRNEGDEYYGFAYSSDSTEYENNAIIGQVRRYTTRGDRYHPLGKNFSPLDFQNQILDAETDGAVKGEMDVAFWFKTTHENFRNRSLRYSEDAADASKPVFFNSNIGNHSEFSNGFLMSFWFRRNGSFSTTKHTSLLAGRNNRWGVCVTRDGDDGVGSGDVILNTNARRRLALWFNSDTNWIRETRPGAYDSNGDDNSKIQMMFISETQIPNDQEWHHVTVHYNGKVGQHCAAAFSIDGGAVEIAYQPYRSTMAAYNLTQKYRADYPHMTLGPSYYTVPEDEAHNDYMTGVNVINCPDTENLLNYEIGTSNINMAELVIIENPLDPIHSTELRNMLYNFGQTKAEFWVNPRYGDHQAGDLGGTLGYDTPAVAGKTNQNFANSWISKTGNDPEFRGQTAPRGGTDLVDYADHAGTAAFKNGADPSYRLPFQAIDGYHRNKTSAFHNTNRAKSLSLPVYRTRRPYFEAVAVDRSGNLQQWRDPRYATYAAGWTVSFNFTANRYNSIQNSLWDQSPPIVYPYTARYDKGKKGAVIHLVDDNNKTILYLCRLDPGSLAKGPYGGHMYDSAIHGGDPTAVTDLIGFQQWTDQYGNSKQALISFSMAAKKMFDGNPHHIVLTTAMKTDSNGDAKNCELYIDGERFKDEVTPTVISRPHGALNDARYDLMRALNDHRTAKRPTEAMNMNDTQNARRLLLFAQYTGHDDDVRHGIGNLDNGSREALTFLDSNPMEYHISQIKLFPQYLGDCSAATGDPAARQQLQYLNPMNHGGRDPDHGTNGVQDASWRWPATTRNVTGTDGVTVTGGDGTGVKFWPPWVDCPLAGTTSGDILSHEADQEVIQIKNLARKFPFVSHYYKLGTESNFLNHDLHSLIKKTSLPNSARTFRTPTDFITGIGTRLTASVAMKLDSGSRHWHIDAYQDRDVNTSGVEKPRNSTGQQRHQQLFFIGDRHDVANHPRTGWQGIELFLSASGGGYRLVSVLGREGSGTDQRKQSAQNLIIPNRWYFVHAQYAGCTSGGTPTANIYLNGQQVDFESNGGNIYSAGDPSRTFDVLTSNQVQHALTFGGAGNITPYRGLAGYMQDIAIWKSNQTVISGRNHWDGMRAGSSHIDTDNNQLSIACKTGFYEGSPTALKITKVAGELSPDGDTYGGFSDTSRAYITGPPILHYRSQAGTPSTFKDTGATVVSFWASLSQVDREVGIIGFNSDKLFPLKHYENSDADSGISDQKSKMVTPTETSNYSPDNTTHRNLRVTIRKQPDDSHRLKLYHGGVVDYLSTDLDGDDHVTLFVDAIDASGATDYTPGVAGNHPELNTFFHNTVIMSKDKVRWYINGKYAGEATFDLVDIDHGIRNDVIYDAGERKEHFNGWNNITVLEEDNSFKAGSKIDEVAVLFYPDLGSSTTNQNELARSIFGGGTVYDFSLRKANLYAWWRMGENNASNLPFATTEGNRLTQGDKIDDESGRPAYAKNHLRVLKTDRLTAVERQGLSATDLRHHWSFNLSDGEVDGLLTKIPYGNVSGLHADNFDPTIGDIWDDGSRGNIVDLVAGRNLKIYNDTGNHNWVYDYSYDSYELKPLNWMVCETAVTEPIITGKNKTTNISGIGRLRYDAAGNNADRRVTHKAFMADFAIFRGASNNYNGTGDSGPAEYDTTNATKAKTIIKFGAPGDPNEMPIAGDELIIIANPRRLASDYTGADGEARVLTIKFTDAATASDSAFTAGVASVNMGHADADDITEICTVIKALLDDTSGLGTTYWTTATSGTNSLIITAENRGGDGKYEVIGKYIGSQGQKRCTITSMIGASHLSKALTRSPSRGWVRMDDSDFSRGTYDNAFTNGTSGSRGLFPTMVGTTPVIKPYIYYLQTRNDGSRQGDWTENRGLAGGTFDLKEDRGNLDLYTYSNHYAGSGMYDSGSVVTMELNNTPQLDFNDIYIASSSVFTNNISASAMTLVSPRAPRSLIGGATGARSGFGPGILQNNYNQFAQEIEQGDTKTIDSQLSASACLFRRHSLTASTSFVSPTSGFLAKLSASHDDGNISRYLIGDMSASHLFLGSAKWEAGDFAGYYNDEGTFVFKPKRPFFDNYGAFIEEARPLMKDYGVVPEFRISEHVDNYLVKGATEQKLDFLNITGGLASADTSNKKDFYKIYSTTDFLKHFEMIQEDHSDFVDPFAIRLRCSVVKKFLPYEGFYPAQRTVQVAQQFFRSYGDNINIKGMQNEDGTFVEYDFSKETQFGFQYLLNPLFSPGIMYNTIKSGVAVDYPLVTETGSVKSIRYLDTDGSSLVRGGAMITEQFDTRIPFEALLEPEKHLANITLASNEPDENGKTGIEIEWGGEGDQLYNLMVSNFLAETSEFFLENKSFTSLASLSQGDPNFGNAQKGNIYMMRLKMYRTTTGQKAVQRNRLSKSYGVPQDTGSMTEAFTMYSRPSAFGPPQYLSGSLITANTWSDFKFDGTSGSTYVATVGNPFRNLKAVPFQHDFSYVTGATYGNPYGVDADGIPLTTNAPSGAVGNEAHKGFNYPFTPPYYHGEAWADITFIPTESKKFTLQEIINQSSVEFYRYFAGAGTLDPDGVTPTTIPVGDRFNTSETGEHVGTAKSALSYVHDRTVAINDQAMQIASSVNIFSQGVLEQDITAQGAEGITNTTNVQVDTDISNKYRWIIQTKFETPILNFNRYTYGKHTTGVNNVNGVARIDVRGDPLPHYTDNSYGIELPGVGPMQTPIGMWHQYGHIPQNSKEGVFLQVDDVPKSWIRNAMHREPAVAKRHKSLATLCGFSTDPVRMGEVAGVKEISEAVIAIPFFEKAGRRRFFSMNKRQIRLALDPARKNLVGRTVVDMVEKMQKFVIPPSLDFVANPQIQPFSMYIFEFNHNLTKRDLADIWQNLPPELNQTVETDEVSISHQLLAYELLGKGGRYRRGRNSEVELIRNDRAESINPEIQWMVFKVKQRAKTNYFEKIFARNESQQLLSKRLRLGVSADALGRKKKISYNWPYDFFSMIEGVKLNTEVHFLDFDEEASQAQEKPVIKPKTKDTSKNRQQRTAVSRRLLGAVSGKVPPDQLKKTPEEVDKKPKRKKGKITRKRRVKMTVKKPNTQKKKLNNAFDRKKLK